VIEPRDMNQTLVDQTCELFK